MYAHRHIFQLTMLYIESLSVTQNVFYPLPSENHIEDRGKIAL